MYSTYSTTVQYFLTVNLDKSSATCHQNKAQNLAITILSTCLLSALLTRETAADF
jgi:hypothetical protein